MTVAISAGVVDQIREARAVGSGLRIVSGGTWLDAGAPCAAQKTLDLGALAGVTEYEPGDLTLTARASTPLVEIARTTAAHGQWLPLDPFGSSGGTLGATVATASYGPLAAAFGTPRNQVLGCEIVTGSGEVVRAGGKVVKNVAGFDLTRLMIGAWGTLGALTEVTVRLRARPEVDATMAIALGGIDSVERMRRWLRTSEFTPFAAELLSPSLAGLLDIQSANAPVLLLRVGGNAALVRAALGAAGALGDVSMRDGAVWRALSETDPPASIVVRLSTSPSRIGSLWSATWRVIELAGGYAHANLTCGVIRCVLPTDGSVESPSRPQSVFHALGPSTRIAERAPAQWWAPLSDALSMGVRRVFDPHHLLNRGIMGTLRALDA